MQYIYCTLLQNCHYTVCHQRFRKHAKLTTALKPWCPPLKFLFRAGFTLIRVQINADCLSQEQVSVYES